MDFLGSKDFTDLAGCSKHDGVQRAAISLEDSKLSLLNQGSWSSIYMLSLISYSRQIPAVRADPNRVRTLKRGYFRGVDRFWTGFGAISSVASLVAWISIAPDLRLLQFIHLQRQSVETSKQLLIKNLISSFAESVTLAQHM